jgi:hypothetical protein
MIESILIEIATQMIISVAGRAYRWMVGGTTPQKITDISVWAADSSAQLEALSRELYYLRQQEVRDTSVSRQRIITDLSQIRQVAHPIQQALGGALILSTPMTAPDRVQAVDFEKILDDIRPLRGIPASADDPTLRPVVFTKEGQAFVGFLRIDSARPDLHLEYKPLKPQGRLILPPSTPPDVLKLVKRLGGGDALDCKRAAEDLATIGAPAVRSLREILRFPRGQVRDNAVRALGGMGRTAIPVWIQVLKSPDNDFTGVRESAVRTLGGFQPPPEEAISALIEALGDREKKVRDCVDEALTRLGHLAEQALEKAVKDPRYEVSRGARRILDKSSNKRS